MNDDGPLLTRLIEGARLLAKSPAPHAVMCSELDAVCDGADTLIALLRACREVIEDSRDLLLESSCQLNRDGTKRETLDKEARPWIEHYEELLAEIDAAPEAEPGS